MFLRLMFTMLVCFEIRLFRLVMVMGSSAVIVKVMVSCEVRSCWFDMVWIMVRMVNMLML